MSPNHNNGGLHGCTGNVLPPTSYCGQAVGGGSALVEPFAAISYMEGLSNYLGPDVQVHYARGVASFAEMAEATVFTTAAANGQPGLNAEYFNNPELQGLTRIALSPRGDRGNACRAGIERPTNLQHPVLIVPA